MNYIRKSESRGKADFGWLQSRHSFSFGNYYDEQHMGVSALRVINDDLVMPGQGFAEHGHRDMEIISYVTEGALKHKDSTGNEFVVPAGDVQRMSAGRGVMHSEFNASDQEQVKFLQIWIQPDVLNITPSYEQKSIQQQGPLTVLVNPKGDDGALSINQNASLSRLVLKQGESFRFSTDDQIGYLHLINGQLSAQNHVFQEGDGFAIEAEKNFEVKAVTDMEALWFDLPKP